MGIERRASKVRFEDEIEEPLAPRPPEDPPDERSNHRKSPLTNMRAKTLPLSLDTEEPVPEEKSDGKGADTGYVSDGHCKDVSRKSRRLSRGSSENSLLPKPSYSWKRNLTIQPDQGPETPYWKKPMPLPVATPRLSTRPLKSKGGDMALKLSLSKVGGSMHNKEQRVLATTPLVVPNTARGSGGSKWPPLGAPSKPRLPRLTTPRTAAAGAPMTDRPSLRRLNSYEKNKLIELGFSRDMEKEDLYKPEVSFAEFVTGKAKSSSLSPQQKQSQTHTSGGEGSWEAANTRLSTAPASSNAPPLRDGDMEIPANVLARRLERDLKFRKIQEISYAPSWEAAALLKSEYRARRKAERQGKSLAIGYREAIKPAMAMDPLEPLSASLKKRMKFESSRRLNATEGAGKSVEEEEEEEIDLEQHQISQDRWYRTQLQETKIFKQSVVPKKRDVKKVQLVLCGNVDPEWVIELPKSVVRIFTSSTFTDTELERNRLMKEVYPYLKELCSLLDWDWQVVDMRWGVREQAGNDHSTEILCLSEVRKCCRESAGPAIVVFLGDKSGFRPMPVTIEQAELERMLRQLRRDKRFDDIQIIEKWYRLDENSVPPRYLIQHVSSNFPDFISSDRDKQRAASNSWWADFEKLCPALRRGSRKLRGDISAKYNIAITQKEIETGIVNNKERDAQGFVFKRNLQGIKPTDVAARFWCDVAKDDKTGEPIVDESGWSLIQYLKQRIVPDALLPENINEWNVEWQPGGLSLNRLDHALYVNDFVKTFAKKMTESIRKSYSESKMENDPIYIEVVTHRAFLIKNCKLFVGREEELEKVRLHIKANNRLPLVIKGGHGVGKTAFMAKAAKMTFDALPDNIDDEGKGGVVVFRFLGTTPFSSTILDILACICAQITRAYGKDPSEVPTNYKKLLAYFPKCLAYATIFKPLIIFIDALDQLSVQYEGRNMSWLPDTLPSYVSIVVSTVEGQSGCLDSCRQVLGKASVEREISIKSVSQEDIPTILDKILAEDSRMLQDDQRNQIIGLTSRSPNPLYLHLLCDFALRWKSYSPEERLAGTIDGIIQSLFLRLENTHGHMLVSRAMSYITLSKYGLSQMELEDILSCDDEVLDDVYQWWVPPMRRLPPLLWIRVRNDLGDHLAESGFEGIALYKWFHAQFVSAVKQRYLSTGVDTMYAALADYFCGRYADGKSHKPEDPPQDRGIHPQPLCIRGTLKSEPSARALNLRRLHELPHAEIRSGRAKRIVNLMTDLDFMEANLIAGNFYGLVHSFLEALDVSSLSEDQKTTVTEFSRFLRGEGGQLVMFPHLTFQVAHNQAEASPVCAAARDQDLTSTDPWVCHINKESTINRFPTISVMNGHTDTITKVCISDDGRYIASASADKTVRVWDTRSGQPKCLLNGHEESVLWCGFGDTHDEMWSCSKDLTVKKWDIANNELLETFSTLKDWEFFKVEGGGLLVSRWKRTVKKIQDSAISACCRRESDGAILVTARKGLQVGIIDAISGKSYLNTKFDDFLHTGTYSPKGDKFGCCFMDGSVLVVDTMSGKTDCHVTVLMTKLWAETAPSWSRDLSYFIFSSNDDAIVYDLEAETKVQVLRGHADHVKSTDISGDNKFVVAGAKDSRLRLFSAETGSHLGLLSGHADTVTTLSFSQDHKLLVSASADQTVRLWDLTETNNKQAENEESKSGHADTVSKVVYSHDYKKFATCSKDKTARIWEATTGKELHVLESHTEEVLDCLFSVDDSKLLTASKDKLLILWSVGDGSKLQVFTGHTEAVVRGDMHPLEPLVISASSDSTLRFWNAETGKEVATCQSHSQPLTHCTFAASGNHAASSSTDSSIIVWDVASRGRKKVRCSTTESLGLAVNGCVFCKDETKLLSRSEDCTVRLWDVRQGRVLSTMQGHFGQITSFFPRSELGLVVSTSDDMTVRLWDINSGKEVSRFEGHTDDVTGCYLSQSGAAIVSCSSDNTVRLWDVATGAVLAMFTWRRKLTYLDVCEVNRHYKFLLVDSNGEVIVLHAKNLLVQ